MPIDSPIRELMFELTRIFELTADCLAPVEGFALCVLMMPLLIKLDLLVTLVVGRFIFKELDCTLLFEMEVCLFELIEDIEGVVRLEVTLIVLRCTVVVVG